MEPRGYFRLAPLLLGLVAVAGVMVYGCQQGPFGRPRVITLSPDQETQLGAQAFQQVLQQERGHIVTGQPINDAVERVGRNLARASEDPELRRFIGLKPMKFDWEFRVIDSKQINAFCLPGGKVVVYTAILPVCQTEAGLATVMGHEIGHALARHGAERIADQQMVQIGQQAAAASLGNVSPQERARIMALLGAGSNVGILLPFSRKQESEADHIGILLMARAGYDPAEAVDFWKRMDRATDSGGRPPQFLSTHPNPGKRIEDLRGWLPQAEKFYRISDRQRPRNLPGIRGGRREEGDF